MSVKSPSLRRLMLVTAAAAALAGAAVVPTIAQDAAPATAAPAARPALAQLDGELRGLYRDVEAGVVRVHLPAPALTRLFGPDVEGLRQHPLRKWEPLLDDEVRRLLPRDRDGRPRLRFELQRDDEAAATEPSERVNATTRPTQQQQQQEQPGARDMPLDADRAIVRALEDPDGLTMMVFPDEAGDDGFSAFIYDDQGHVVVPTYVDKRALRDRRVRVTAGDRQVDATCVGADRQTNLTVLKLDQPTGTPLQLGNDKPAAGSLVLMLAPRGRSVDLGVWTAARDASGIVITAADARVAGVVRSGQMLAGDALRPVVDELIKSGSVKRAKLGAMIFDVAADDPIRERVPLLGARPAVRIVKVLPDSAAAAAGLCPNDLILSLAGEPVSDIPTFAAAISNRQGPTELKIIREGREQTVTVDLKQE